MFSITFGVAFLPQLKIFEKAASLGPNLDLTSIFVQ